MPVMVTGTDNPIGDGAVHLLRSRGGEVRVFVQSSESDPTAASTTAPMATDAAAARAYRGMGCKVAHGFLDDEAHVETALEQVHTVLHLLGRPADDPNTYLERTATVVAAAIDAGCRRLVLLSDLSVTDPRSNDWLQALEQAEDMAADAPLESVVLRCAVVYGPDDALTTAVAAGGLGPDPQGAHWPVAAADVAAAAVLADVERQVDTDLFVPVSLTGPQRVTTAAFAKELAAHFPTIPGDPLPTHAKDLLGRTVERPPDAMGLHGRALTAGS